MKKILFNLVILLMLLPWLATAQPTEIFVGGGGGVATASNCDVEAYYAIGKLCQDTDDGKLYKGTGSGVTEIAAGSSGDFLADGSVPMTGNLQMGAHNITGTGSLGATGAGKFTKLWAIDMELTNAPTINGAAWTTILQPLNATLTALAAQTESQGALQYYTADATPAVLAKGTAYQLLQMNSGATAPEWASSLSISALNLTSATSSIPWVVSATTPATFNLDGMAYYESDVYKLFIRDQTNTRNLAFIPEGIATGGLIFGDDSPDAAGEIGYDGELKYYDAVGSKTVATVKVEKLAVFNIDGTAADNTVIDSYIPVASTITGAIITTTGTACSAVVDIWSDTYANFPATNDDSIVASAPPTLSTATAAKPTITTWEKSIPADSVLRANLDSSDCTGVIQVTLIGTK